MTCLTVQDRAPMRRRVPMALVLLSLSGSALALIGGQPDADGRFASVVSLMAGPDLMCSATKVGLRSFLTAAHCVIDVPAGGLARMFQPGGGILVSNRAEVGKRSDYQALTVEETWLPEPFETGLRRLHAYHEGRIADLRLRHAGQGLERAIRRVYADAHISARFPDVAIVRVRGETPAIPVTPVDLRPLSKGDDVVLVGYGCERAADLGEVQRGRLPVRRSWGRSEIIRVDVVNFYTFAGELQAGTPATCPGDSGGPVLREGRVVGVHGTVYGLNPAASARSNMSANLHGLADWDGWSRLGTVPELGRGPGQNGVAR